MHFEAKLKTSPGFEKWRKIILWLNKFTHLLLYNYFWQKCFRSSHQQIETTWKPHLLFGLQFDASDFKRNCSKSCYANHHSKLGIAVIKLTAIFQSQQADVKLSTFLNYLHMPMGLKFFATYLWSGCVIYHAVRVWNNWQV